MGRAKTNILIAQFGRVKEDCLDALKIRDSEQLYVLLAKSRLLVERYRDAIEYSEKGLQKFKDSKSIKAIYDRAKEEEKKEISRIGEVSTMQALAKDKKLSVYRNLRSKRVKIGKKIHYLPEIVEVAITEDSQNKLHFPVLILYDEYMATDFI